MKSVLLIFLDGVGIGKKNPSTNPFFKYPDNFLYEQTGKLPHEGNLRIHKNDTYVFPIDSCMDIEGIPQSGTGQASIFCGINAAKKIGKHFGPFAYSTLIPLIQEKNIFRELKTLNQKTFFANAYPKPFFDYLKSGRKRIGVIAMSYLSAGFRLNTITGVRKGKALSAEITNQKWVERFNYNLPIIKPETAAKRLLQIASSNNFTVFEYFLTDHLGHGRNTEEFENIFFTFDRFMKYLMNHIPEEITMLLCSDHGNIEDLSIKSHTLNPALGMAKGREALRLSSSIKSLYHIKKEIIRILK